MERSTLKAEFPFAQRYYIKVEINRELYSLILVKPISQRHVRFLDDEVCLIIIALKA